MCSSDLNVVITHDIQSAFEIADHVVLLHRGKIAAQGSVSEILQNEDPLRGRTLPRAIVDLVPAAAPTPLVKRARATENVTVVDGLSMLLHQAARSFQLWTGLEPPVAVMRAALPRPV